LNYLDIFIVAVLAIGFLLGFKDGLVRKIIGLIGLIVAFAVAFEFSDKAALIILPVFQDEYFANIVAGILIFLIVILITSIIKRIVHPLDKTNRFINQFLGGVVGVIHKTNRFINQFLGGVVGVIQIVFFLSGFLLFLNIFNLPSKSSENKSILYSKVYNVIPNSIDFVIGHRSKATDFIKDFIENKDNSSSNDLIDTLKNK